MLALLAGFALHQLDVVALHPQIAPRLDDDQAVGFEGHLVARLHHVEPGHAGQQLRQGALHRRVRMLRVDDGQPGGIAEMHQQVGHRLQPANRSANADHGKRRTLDALGCGLFCWQLAVHVTVRLLRFAKIKQHANRKARRGKETYKNLRKSWRFNSYAFCVRYLHEMLNDA
jgi:hypothetical protein